MTKLSITGASLSGSDGTADRTYTVSDSFFSSTDLRIIIGGTYAYEGAAKDYTVSGSTITFLNNVWNDQSIDVFYSPTSASTTASSYGSTLELARFMGLELKIPDIAATSSTRLKETVGTGDGTETIFWLDYGCVLAGSYTLYYGAAEASATALTETTHYTIDKDLGKITLTTAGATLVSTNDIYAAYSYVRKALFTDTQLQNALNRAQDEIDSLTNNHFAVSTDATPDWNQHLDEEQDGKGVFDRNYFTLQNYPIPSVSTALNGAVTADDGTITVDSTNGFPSSGYLLIEDDKIAYTGKTTTTFTGCTSVSAHDDDTVVQSYVVEVSTTEPGGSISWNILKEGTEFELDNKTGRVHVYSEVLSGSGSYADVGSSPLRLVPNRFRISYLSGYSSIPNEIVKATLMLASKDIMAMAVRAAHSSGMNEFNPSVLEVDQAEIDKIVMKYKNEQFSMC